MHTHTTLPSSSESMSASSLSVLRPTCQHTHTHTPTVNPPLYLLQSLWLSHHSPHVPVPSPVWLGVKHQITYLPFSCLSVLHPTHQHTHTLNPLLYLLLQSLCLNHRSPPAPVPSPAPTVGPTPSQRCQRPLLTPACVHRESSVHWSRVHCGQGTSWTWQTCPEESTEKYVKDSCDFSGLCKE